MPKPTNTRGRRNVPADTYQDALAAFLTALGIEGDTVFEVIATPSQTVVKHARYTQQENGVHSGDFWEDVINRGN